MLRRIADLAANHPWRVLAVAFVLAIGAGAYGGSVADRLEPYSADDPASESVRAHERLRDASPVEAEAGVIALVEGRPDGRRMRDVVRTLGADPGVGVVRSPLRSHDPALVARDGRSAYAVAQFRIGADEEDTSDALVAALDDRPGVTVGGFQPAQTAVGDTVERDLRRAELIAFPLLFLLSLLFFRSVVAALLPLLVGGLAILGTFFVLRAATGFTDVSIFALNLTTGLGLGLAIDYSLFIVSRYREELARHAASEDHERKALRATMATAGRTVLFSSLTVAAALAALLTFPQNFLYSMGIGGMSVALIAAAVALLVLPAVLALLGERVNALGPARLQRAAAREARPASSGAWYRLSRFVMRRPLRVAVLSGAVLVALGLPFTGVRFVTVDASVLPAGEPARTVDDRLAADFPPNRTEPVMLVARGAGRAQLRAYARQLRHVPGVAAVAPPVTLDGGVTLTRVLLKADAVSPAAERTLRDIRALDAPVGVLAGGRTAEFVDQKESLVDHLPLALLIVFGATFVVLFLMTGSVVLPVKAAIMNLLTISAAFGILVLIFQDGRLEGLLDYRSQGGLESTQPLLLFVVAFGLSTDYAVFLLSRIKEARDHGVGDSEAVAVGIERTGRIVTSAALLFAIAIGAFATSQIIFIKQLGLGTAVAVLIDATLVRALLVPALMELLGRRNWWAPPPLRRLHDRFGLSEG
jgi:RND superfamily putative drug exporter